MLQVMRELHCEGGLLRFFKGRTPAMVGMDSKLLQTVLNSAIMLTLYERLSKVFLGLIRLLRKRTAAR